MDPGSAAAAGRRGLVLRRWAPGATAAANGRRRLRCRRPECGTGRHTPGPAWRRSHGQDSLRGHRPRRLYGIARADRAQRRQCARHGRGHRLVSIPVLRAAIAPPRGAGKPDLDHGGSRGIAGSDGAVPQCARHHFGVRIHSPGRGYGLSGASDAASRRAHTAPHRPAACLAHSALEHRHHLHRLFRTGFCRLYGSGAAGDLHGRRTHRHGLHHSMGGAPAAFAGDLPTRAALGGPDRAGAAPALVAERCNSGCPGRVDILAASAVE